MRLTNAIVVILDISGYTAFIRHRAVTLAHAEDIVTSLLETVIDRAEHPLTLNKLEGDAALLWCEAGSDPAAAARSVLAQVEAAFADFAARLQRMKGERSHCSCDACANIGVLELKALVHCGEIALKQVRQFEELAGEPVIVAHRLLKNRVPVRNYLLVTDSFRALAGVPGQAQSLREDCEGIGEVDVWWRAIDAGQQSRAGPTAD
jgi:hypothetical protein